MNCPISNQHSNVMSPTRKARSSRKDEIPRGFLLNWQPSGTQDGKPLALIRRPATACEACRAAKVKCSGQLDCDRCTNRGTPCRYTTPSRSESTEPPPQTRPRATDAWPTVAQASSDDINMDLSVDIPIQAGLEKGLWPGRDWPNDGVGGQQGMDTIDWSAIDMSLGVSSHLNFPMTLSSRMLTEDSLWACQHHGVRLPVT